MSKDYHHLAYHQRCQLYALKKRGDSFCQIAKELGVHKSTISREISRNQGKKGYRFKQAQQKAILRRSQASSKAKKMTDEMVFFIERKLQLQWSPEQISGRLKKKGGNFVSHETIYRYVWRNKRKGGLLYKQLRHNGKRYNKRRAGKAGRGCIPNRIDIDKRPPIVDRKCRLGDWELDTIIGKKHKGAIVSIVERASKLTKLVKIPSKTAIETEQAIIEALAPIKDFALTLTADNGKEFARHSQVSKQLGASFFFATPYHSWERGLNEHTNGLVRQYFPKSRNFEDITEEDVQAVELLLNIRPRKVLNFSNPIEAFQELSQRSKIVALQN